MTDVQMRSSAKFLTRAGDEDDYIIEGYFSVFETETELFPGYFESIGRSAFNNSDFSDVKALIDHKHDKVLGRTKSGTLELVVDSTGLFGKIKVNKNDTEAMNLYERVKRGDVDQCSFGFRIRDEELSFEDDGKMRSRLTDLDLIEVSVVTFPAYEQTSVSARKKDVEEAKRKKLELQKMKLKERVSKWHSNN